MSGHKKIAYLCTVELQYHGYDKQNLRAAAHGSCTTTRDGTGQAFVGRPGQRHVHQPRAERRLLRPRRHTRRREILYDGLRLPLYGHAGAGVQRHGELAHRQPDFRPSGLSGLEREPALRRSFSCSTSSVASSVRI